MHNEFKIPKFIITPCMAGLISCCFANLAPCIIWPYLGVTKKVLITRICCWEQCCVTLIKYSSAIQIKYNTCHIGHTHHEEKGKKRKERPTDPKCCPQKMRSSNPTATRQQTFCVEDIGQEELVSCSSDYSTRWLAIK
jgi:hypothetical protein